MCNYCPISVILHVPKILEFFVRKQLVQYLNKINLLSKNQFAYICTIALPIQLLLSSRSQIVKVNGKISNVCTVNIGIPQGTILGPIFFVIYVNDFDNFKNFTCIRYADDSSLSSTGYSPSDVELKLQSALGADHLIHGGGGYGFYLVIKLFFRHPA